MSIDKKKRLKLANGGLLISSISPFYYLTQKTVNFVSLEVSDKVIPREVSYS